MPPSSKDKPKNIKHQNIQEKKDGKSPSKGKSIPKTQRLDRLNTTPPTTTPRSTITDRPPDSLEHAPTTDAPPQTLTHIPIDKEATEPNQPRQISQKSIDQPDQAVTPSGKEYQPVAPSTTTSPKPPAPKTTSPEKTQEDEPFQSKLMPTFLRPVAKGAKSLYQKGKALQIITNIGIAIGCTILPIALLYFFIGLFRSYGELGSSAFQNVGLGRQLNVIETTPPPDDGVYTLDNPKEWFMYQQDQKYIDPNTPLSYDIKPAGCLLTSNAMVLKFLGFDTDPLRLVKEHGLNPNSVNFGTIETEFPGVTRTANQDTFNFQDHLTFIMDNIDNGYPVVIGAGPDIAGGDQHYLVVTGYDKTKKEIYVNDPNSYNPSTISWSTLEASPISENKGGGYHHYIVTRQPSSS